MHSVNFTIKSGFSKTDGTTPIYLVYNLDRKKRTLFKTGKYIDPKFWNIPKKEVRRSYPEAQYLNQYLQSLKLKMEQIIDSSIIKGITPSINFVRDEFYKITSPDLIKNQKTFMDYFEEYIEVKKSKVVIDVIKDYNSLKKHLEGHEKHYKEKVSFKKINQKFYDNFVYYLENVSVKRDGTLGLQKSSVGKQIKNLKAFLNYAMANEYCDYINTSGFKVLNNTSNNIYVSESELEDMLAIDLSDNKKLEEIRDLFVIGCETGLRFSDLTRITRDNIIDENKYIKITMKKTLHDVTIPISNRLRSLLVKYDNQPPINISSEFFNLYIKDIGALAGMHDYVTKIKVIGNRRINEKKRKYDYLSTHTCRRSFCTNQFLKGVPSLYIRKISGHADEKSFLKYIKVDGEEAAKKTYEIWSKIEAPIIEK